MRMVTLRLWNAGQELFRESAEISLAVIGRSDTGGSRSLDSSQRTLVLPNPGDGAYKVRKRSGLIKKSGAAVINKFGNAGNRGSEHKPLVGHAFHQDDGNPLTLAGHYHQVGIAVVAGKIRARHMTDQVNTPLQAQHRDLVFKRRPLRPLANDPAKEVESLVAKLCTGLDQE